MPSIFAASESKVLVNGTEVEGVRSIDYRHVQRRENVYALGSTERLDSVSGPQHVEGRLTVASASAVLDGLQHDTVFQVIAQLKKGDSGTTVSFVDCEIHETSFSLEVGGFGEAVYGFTATRVTREPLQGGGGGG